MTQILVISYLTQLYSSSLHTLLCIAVLALEKPVVWRYGELVGVFPLFLLSLPLSIHVLCVLSVSDGDPMTGTLSILGNP